MELSSAESSEWSCCMISACLFNLFSLNKEMEIDQQETDCFGPKLMGQGAEGRLFLSDLFGQPCVVKERFVKKYRVPQLDEKLTKSRINQEVKSMDRVRKLGVPTPGVYLVD